MTAITANNVDSRNAKPENLHVASFHHRVDWGDMDGLAASIREHGILVPLLVRERPRALGGYEIIHGARRHRAAEMAELKLIPIRIVDVDDATAIQMQMDENLQRQGLHPMDEALYFKDLSDCGMDAAAIAKRFGRKRSDVVRRMALLGLCDRARAAFVKGTIDEPAALAIATLDVQARQHDILAAIAQGSLQVEEVPGFVAREMQASLEDVPWRVSDAELVPAAGACSACPKRTSVQRDLFAEGRGDRCRDLTCYRKKMDATFAIAATKPGVQVSEDPASSLFMPTVGGRPGVMKSSGFVDAEAACPHMTGYTWRDAIAAAQDDDNPPTLYLARDQDRRPRYLFREPIVTRLVKRSDAAAAQAKAREDADPARPDVSARAEAKVRKSVIAQLAETCAAGDHDTWGWIVGRIVEGATAREVAQAADQFEEAIKQEAGGAEGKAGLLALATRSNRWAKRVALAILIRAEADFVGEVPATLRELAAICGVDVGEIEREVRGGPAAPADEAA